MLTDIWVNPRKSISSNVVAVYLEINSNRRHGGLYWMLTVPNSHCMVRNMQIARLSPRDSNKWVQHGTQKLPFYKLLAYTCAAGPGTTLGTAKLKDTFLLDLCFSHLNVLKCRLQLSRWRGAPVESTWLWEKPIDELTRRIWSFQEQHLQRK